MYSKYLHIILFLCIFSQSAFSSSRDTLNLDTDSEVNVNQLPDNFKDDYDSKDFVYEYKTDNDGLTWSERLTRWFFNLIQRIFKFEPTQKGLQYTGYLVKAIYYIAVLAVIFLIVRSLMRKEGYWVFGKKSDKLEILTDNVELDIKDTNFDKLINDATSKSNYSLATRYYYLKTLKVLTQKGFIEWDIEKTNLDYMMEIEDNALRKKFQYISYIYNYCWYGEFELNSSSFIEVETSFQSLLKTLK